MRAIRVRSTKLEPPLYFTVLYEILVQFVLESLPVDMIVRGLVLSQVFIDGARHVKVRKVGQGFTLRIRNYLIRI